MKSENFVGKTWGDEVSEADIAVAFGPKNIQVIPDGHSATSEFRSGRVRVWLGKDNKIKRISEG